MAIELTGKVCLITGADEGIGRGLAEGFAKRGARVVAGMLRPSVARPFPEGLEVQMDVTKADEVGQAVETVVQRFGRIDVLVNNAGIYPRVPADQLTFAQWRQVMDINLDGSFRCCEAVIPHFKRQGGGVIINIGSNTVRFGHAELPHYIASKAGIIGLTRGMARDLGRYNIRVNCVHLGGVRTEGEERIWPGQADSVRARFESFQSMRGRMTPVTIEPIFAFLASEDSGDITGQCLTADRGWTHE